MRKYLVTYHECYSRGYEVEANSKEEAEEIVKNDIFEGKRGTPDNCYDSGCNTVLIEDHIETIIDRGLEEENNKADGN